MAGPAPIGVVIPAYGHPRLLAEAITSACQQVLDRPLKVVVVDDGCLQQETRDIIQSAMHRFRGILYSVRQQNTRLPGARNKGIDFLLALAPDLDSVYFLDADNRLAAHSLQTFRSALGDDPSIGWAYPDIGFFGYLPHTETVDVRETAPNHSILKHLVANISEAGSLVRGDVLRSGARFDERLTVGFEDWDFWLRVIGLGKRGVRALNTGFSYRKRPESMLAEATRQHERLTAHLMDNHPQLFNRPYIDQIRHAEAPMFALLRIPEGCRELAECQAHLFLDFDAEHQQLDGHAFADLARRKIRGRREHFFPDHILFVSEANWQALAAAEAHLRDMLSRASRVGDRVRLDLTHEDRPRAEIFIEAAVPFLERLASGTDPDLASFRPSHYPALTGIDTAQIPTVGRDDVVAVHALLRTSVEDAVPLIRSQARRYAGPDADTVVRTLAEDFCEHSSAAPTYPKIRKSQDILVSVPDHLLSDPDAVEGLCAHVSSLSRGGASVTFCLERTVQDLPILARDVFRCADHIAVFDPDGEVGHDWHYLGRPFRGGLNEVTVLKAQALVSAFGEVQCVADSILMDVLGVAREGNVRTRVLAHPAFVQDPESAFTNIMAYEHALQAVLGADASLAAQLRAAGLPHAKVQSDVHTASTVLSKPKQTPVPPGWSPEKGYVFVVTHGRSGSTALMQILNSFEGYEIRGENNNILPPLLDFVARVEDIPNNADVFRSHTAPSPWEGSRNIRPDLIRRSILAMVHNQIWSVSKEARCIGFKEIRFANMEGEDLTATLGRMRDIFAPAKFIFNIRPVEETVKSSWFAEEDQESARRNVTTAQHHFQSYCAANPDHSLMLNLADYRSNPEALVPLCSFLGEPYDAQKLSAILGVRLSH